MMTITACAAVVLCACEDASKVQEGATKFDNSDKDALQKQMNETQQQQDQQKQQQELLKKLQEDCQNQSSLARPGVLMFAADLQLAWGSGGGGGGGGGKGGHPTNCP
jgi:hypothetical protein